MTMISNTKNSDKNRVNPANPELSDAEFVGLRDWLYQQTGIHLTDIKKSMITGRLQKRLQALKLARYSDYLRLLKDPQRKEEQQRALNLLTTNETYFFREDKHFKFLSQLVSNEPNRQWQIWSAAASSGEEAYSIAMQLADCIGLQRQWQVLGTDINTAVLEKARRAIYPITGATKIPQLLLTQYCLKGIGKDLGWFRIDPDLRQRVSFEVANLFKPTFRAQKFDVIFLRNVLIYFELDDKKVIVENMLQQLKPGGYLLVGHAESIHGYHDALVQQQASCYRYQPAHLLADSVAGDW